MVGKSGIIVALTVLASCKTAPRPEAERDPLLKSGEGWGSPLSGQVLGPAPAVDTEAEGVTRSPEKVPPSLASPDKEPGGAKPPPKPLEGFDFEGAVTCLPLALGRRCLQAQNLLESACSKAEGQLLVCHDCSLVCSKPVR